MSVLFEPAHTLVVLTGDVGVGLLDDLVEVAADIVRRGAPVEVADSSVLSVDDVGAWFLTLARTVPVRPGWQGDVVGDVDREDLDHEDGAPGRPDDETEADA